MGPVAGLGAAAGIQSGGQSPDGAFCGCGAHRDTQLLCPRLSPRTGASKRLDRHERFELGLIWRLGFNTACMETGDGVLWGGADSSGGAKSRRRCAPAPRWVVPLLVLQTVILAGLAAVVVLVSLELRETADRIPTHDPQANLEVGDLLCSLQDGTVSYRPGLGGVFVHECRYHDPVAGREECTAHDIYGNSWSCSDR